MNLVFTKPIDGFKHPEVWCSATTITASMHCPRRAIIDSYYNNYGDVQSIPALFGTAFGAGAAEVIQHFDKGIVKALEYGCMGLLKFPAYKQQGFRNWGTLLKGLVLFARNFEKLYKKGWRFESAERRLMIAVESHAVTGGSHDICLRHKDTGVRWIVDCKAVGSVYFYQSWPFDPQIIIYTFAAWLHDGRKHTYRIPEYWANEFKSDVDHKLHIFPVESGAMRNMLTAAFAHAKILGAYNGHECGHDISHIPANFTECKRGNFKCFAYEHCYEAKPIRWTPPREVNTGNLEIVNLTEGELREAIEEFCATYDQSRAAHAEAADAIEKDILDLIQESDATLATDDISNLFP